MPLLLHTTKIYLNRKRLRISLIKLASKTVADWELKVPLSQEKSNQIKYDFNSQADRPQPS